jgi:hypothetical protein
MNSSLLGGSKFYIFKFKINCEEMKSQAFGRDRPFAGLL